MFAALFASQAAVIAMSPVLARAASDLHVSTAAAGQLRTVTGLAAGLTALTLGAVTARVALGRLLLGASGLLAVGSLASALAPSYPLLVAAQLPVGVAVAVLTSVGTLAAAEWVHPDLRTRTLSWALVGQPAAWIVGMPLVGLVGERNWRYGWLALPLAAAIAAGLLAAPRAGRRPAASRPARARAAVRDRTIARWLASELLANTAWAGTLVFAGALFTESYGASTALTGCLLAVAAAAYVAGNLACRRLVQREPRAVLVLFASCLALVDGLFGVARVDIVGSAALLAAPGSWPAVAHWSRAHSRSRRRRDCGRRSRASAPQRCSSATSSARSSAAPHSPPVATPRSAGHGALLRRRRRHPRPTAGRATDGGARPLLPALYRARG